MRTYDPPPEEAFEEERLAWLDLAEAEGLGPATAWNLVEALGSARGAWSGNGRGLPPRVREALAAARRSPRGAALLGRALRWGDRVLTPADPEYPSRLLHLHDPPCALFASGPWTWEDGPGPVAVVGSRRATPYGLSLAEGLARDLAARGVVVASGLARGIDGAAHRGTLAAGGRTMAILGCGLDVDYPPEHRRLRREIEETGLVVSEYPRGTRPEPWRFPARNRLLAALSEVIVVVQAAARSGALITADLGLEMGRTVLAVPGAVGWVQSEGPLRLLSEGAGLVRNAGDVLDALGILDSPSDRAPAHPPEVRRILEVLGPEGAGVDEVVERTGLGAGPASALLVRLELDGLVRRLPQGVYIAV